MYAHESVHTHACTHAHAHAHAHTMLSCKRTLSGFSMVIRQAVIRPYGVRTAETTHDSRGEIGGVVVKVNGCGLQWSLLVE